MRWIPLPLAFSLALAATSGLAADAPLRPEKLRQAMGLKLGGWQNVSKLADAQIEPGPDADKAQAEQALAALRSQIGKVMTKEQCLWDDTERLLIPGVNATPDCKYSRIEARDGKFSVAATCEGPEPAVKIHMAVDGTYSPDRMTARSEATVSTAGGNVRIRLETESRFTGKCTVPIVSIPSPAKN